MTRSEVIWMIAWAISTAGLMIPTVERVKADREIRKKCPPASGPVVELSRADGVLLIRCGKAVVNI